MHLKIKTNFKAYSHLHLREPRPKIKTLGPRHKWCANSQNIKICIPPIILLAPVAGRQRRHLSIRITIWICPVVGLFETLISKLV